MSHVVHGCADVRTTDRKAFEPDGYNGVGNFVVFEEATEGFDFSGSSLDVCPPSRTEHAKDSLAASPGVGCNAAKSIGGWLLYPWFGNAGGVNSEEGGGAAGGDGGYARGEVSGGVKPLNGDEGGGVDEGRFGAGVEAELAG